MNEAHEGFDRSADHTAAHAAPQAASPVLQTNSQHFTKILFYIIMSHSVVPSVL